VVVLSRGEVQQIAPPMVVYSQPANRFVAEFFGSPKINIVDPPVLGLEAREGLLAGVRPEDVRVGTEGGELRARVDLVEPMGAEAWVTALSRDVRVVARADATCALRRGDETTLAVDRDRVLWFEKESGKRVP
jgi:multiple sugar transport system ATP-binding protein